MKKTKIYSLMMSALLMIVSFYAIVFSTYSWFYNKRDESTNITNLIADSSKDVRIDNWSVYAFNDEEQYGYEVENQNLALNQYDAFITSRNEYNAKYIKFDLLFEHDMSVAKTLKISISCMGSFTTDDIVDKYISNIIQFKAFADINNEIANNDADITYRNAKNVFKNITDSKKYIDDSTTVYNKPKMNLVFSIAIPANTTACTVYLEYNYNESLVNYYNENCGEIINDLEILQGNIIEFNQDIDYIYFNLGN